MRGIGKLLSPLLLVLMLVTSLPAQAPPARHWEVGAALGLATSVPRPWARCVGEGLSGIGHLQIRTSSFLAFQGRVERMEQGPLSGCDYLTIVPPLPPADGDFDRRTWNPQRAGTYTMLAIRAVLTPVRSPGAELRLSTGLGTPTSEGRLVPQVGVAGVLGRGAVGLLLEGDLHFFPLDSIHRREHYQNGRLVSAVETRSRQWFVTPTFRAGVVVRASWSRSPPRPGR